MFLNYQVGHVEFIQERKACGAGCIIWVQLRRKLLVQLTTRSAVSSQLVAVTLFGTSPDRMCHE